MFKTPHILNTSQSCLTLLPDDVLKPLLRSGLAQCSKYFFQLDLSLNEHKYSLSCDDIDSFIQFIGKYNYKINIKSIVFTNINDLDSKKILLKLTNIYSLKSLDFVGCSDITHIGTEDIQYLTQIQSLSLSGSEEQINDEALQHISTLYNLQSLRLVRAFEITHLGISYLSKLTSLQSLALIDCHLTDQGFNHILTLSNLKSIDLSDCSITDDSFTEIQTLGKLESVRLASCPSISDRTLKYLFSHHSIISLSLSDCMISDDGLHNISDLNQMQSLSLIRCGDKISDRGFSFLKKLTLLKLFHFSSSDLITDQGIFYISYFRKLQTLILKNIRKLTAQATSYLKNLSDIHSLFIIDCDIENNALSDLSCLSQLQTLNLLYCKKITYQGLKSLHTNKKLRNVQHSAPLSASELESFINDHPCLEYMSFLNNARCHRYVQKSTIEKIRLSST